MPYLFLKDGDPVNLKSQLEACSYDQLELIPGDNGASVMDGKRAVYEEDNGGGGPDSGTITVTLDIALDGDGVDRYSIHNNARSKAEQKLGISLPGPFHQVKRGRLPSEMRVITDAAASCSLT